MIEDRFAKKQTLDPEAKEAVLKKLKESLAVGAEVLFAYVHGSFVKEAEFRDLR